MNQKLVKRLNRAIDAVKDEKFLALLIELKGELEDTIIKQIPAQDTAALTHMMSMTVMMERAAFIGIMETYKSAKYKLPNCITADRNADGQITAFNVHMGGEDAQDLVTLRNPECVEQEKVVPTSVIASATAKTPPSD